MKDRSVTKADVQKDYETAVKSMDPTGLLSTPWGEGYPKTVVVQVNQILVAGLSDIYDTSGTSYESLSEKPKPEDLATFRGRHDRKPDKRSDFFTDEKLKASSYDACQHKYDDHRADIDTAKALCRSY